MEMKMHIPANQDVLICFWPKLDTNHTNLDLLSLTDNNSTSMRVRSLIFTYIHTICEHLSTSSEYDTDMVMHTNAHTQTHSL